MNESNKVHWGGEGKEKEKEIHEVIAIATPAGAATCTFCEMHFYLMLKMQLLCGFRIAVRRAHP